MNGGKEQAAVRTDDSISRSLKVQEKQNVDQTLVGGHGSGTQPCCSVFQDEGSLSSWWQ